MVRLNSKISLKRAHIDWGTLRMRIGPLSELENLPPKPTAFQSGGKKDAAGAARGRPRRLVEGEVSLAARAEAREREAADEGEWADALNPLLSVPCTESATPRSLT